MLWYLRTAYLDSPLSICNGLNNPSTRDKLLALKLIMECDEAKFALFKEGPAIMQVKSMEERLADIESRDILHYT
jgi:hypothetical protein